MSINLQQHRVNLGPTLRRYVERLEAAVGRETFDAVFDEIRRDPTVKLAEAKALALAMTGLRARSKQDALDLISLPHRTVRGAVARARAIGGRTAG